MVGSSLIAAVPLIVALLAVVILLQVSSQVPVIFKQEFKFPQLPGKKSQVIGLFNN
jgi:lipopolysaccharide/colanic/teichoic acid biosynthesis glycosyltransferase